MHGGAAGATRPMLLSEYSTNITNAHQLQLMELNPAASYTLANNIDLGPALANASDMWGPNGAAGFVPIAGEASPEPFKGKAIRFQISRWRRPLPICNGSACSALSGKAAR